MPRRAISRNLIEAKGNRDANKKGVTWRRGSGEGGSRVGGEIRGCHLRNVKMVEILKNEYTNRGVAVDALEPAISSGRKDSLVRRGVGIGKRSTARDAQPFEWFGLAPRLILMPDQGEKRTIGGRRGERQFFKGHGGRNLFLRKKRLQIRRNGAKETFSLSGEGEMSWGRGK